MRRRIPLSFPFILSAAIACTSERDLVDPGVTMADVRSGRLAFEESCSGCHGASDGFDLKTFGFTDTTIIRRAVRHVDSVTARNIVAYIRSLETPSIEQKSRLFQPGGALLGSDLEFAHALFGRDEWPDDMTPAQLAEIDPREVKVAIELPVWSDEASNLDWMPDVPLPSGVLDYDGGSARSAIAAYQAAPTSANLLRAVDLLRFADRAGANPSSPCRWHDTQGLRYRECFDVRRFTSALVALHMLRYGVSDPVPERVHHVWWDVGDVARLSREDPGVPIANADQNWAAWMWLGWTFEQSRSVSFYGARVLGELGLVRHATFLALRSQVVRPTNSINLYEDLTTAARFAPPSWTASVMTFGLRYIDERQQAGEQLSTPNLRANAIKAVNLAITHAGYKISAAEKIRLQNLAQPIIAMLQ